MSELFSTLDLKDKKCLAILSSGDQTFHLFNKEIKDIDLIDKNKLTIYYFYLRLCTIKYLNMYYPPVNFDCNFISELLKKIKPSSEIETKAYNYWSLFISNFSNREINDLFLTDNDLCDNSISNLSELNEKIDRKYEFYDNDMKDRLFINKKYNFIYLSNLLDGLLGIKMK